MKKLLVELIQNFLGIKKIQDLEENHKIKKSLSNYLPFIRDKRNQSAHPGKQFNQEESERILIHVKDLLESTKYFIILSGIVKMRLTVTTKINPIFLVIIFKL